MKNYTGTAKVKDDSKYVYRGHTLNILGIYADYKNGNGDGVYADGTREYKLSLLGTEFEAKFGKTTVIYDNQLEDINLFETISIPLNEEEALNLIEFSKNSALDCKYKILESFIKQGSKKSVLPIPDLSTLYDDEEFNKIFK